MSRQDMSEFRSEVNDKTEEHARPQELEKYPEKNQYREVSSDRHTEAKFQEKNKSERILNLPRVEGFEKSNLMSDKEVKEYLKDEFPERHVNNITMESVKYNDRYIADKKETEMAHWEKKEVVHGTNVYRKEIIVNRQTPEGSLSREAMKDHIAHEVGHQTYFMYLKEGDRQDWEKISGDRPRKNCVSEYAQKDADEDFAESYSHYVRNPENLREKDADKYNFMRDRVFEGRKYG